MNTIIEKIRAEVERRIKSGSSRGENSPEGQGKDTCVSRVTELTHLLSFLSDLEKEEKPIEGLEEEIKSFAFSFYQDNGNLPMVTDIARHFAQWGAEHLATPTK